MQDGGGGDVVDVDGAGGGGEGEGFVDQVRGRVLFELEEGVDCLVWVKS